MRNPLKSAATIRLARRRAALAVEAIEPRLLMTATGFIGGYALHADGSAAPGATIQLYNDPGPTTPSTTATANADGYYHFDNLAPGTYDVAESEAGHVTSAVDASTTINPAVAINHGTAFQVTVVDPSAQAVTITNGPGLYPPATTYYSVADGPFNDLTAKGDTTHQYNLALAGNQGNNHAIVSLCSDLYHGIGGGAIYPTAASLTPQATGPAATPATSAANLGRIGYLYNHYGRFAASTPTDGAGLQLAQWELLYDTTDDLFHGNFRLNATGNAQAIVDAANGYLAASAGKSEEVYFLNVGKLSGDVGGQSMVATDLLNFTSVAAVSISGTVYHDKDASGSLTGSDAGLGGVALTLTDAAGNAVATTTTAADGTYCFTATASGQPLAPGTYTVIEAQPAGYLQGTNTVGQVNGAAVGSLIPTDVIGSIVLAPGQSSVGNNFGEVVASGDALAHGQTATIGFWHNKNGQALINGLNGGPTAKALGHWLASSFPNMYGNLGGQTNAQIAGVFQDLFNQKGAKVGAQVLATALAVYATDSDLAGGKMAASYGFTVNTNGTGASTYNVGTALVPLGGPAGKVTIFQLLKFADSKSSNGRLANGNPAALNLFNTIFDGINQGGDI